jgi:Planctomycete cytochrome C
MLSSRRIVLTFLMLATAGATRGYADSNASLGATEPRPLNFAREVRPILSDNCFACHGPDERARKAGLRLDTKDGAFAPVKSGGRTIVPGNPDESELVFRIESDDSELHMPPKKSGKQLTAEQVAVLR